MKFGPKLLIRLDDVAEHMNWKYMEKCESIFDHYRVNPIMGVIPDNLDEDLKTWPKKKNFWEKVRQWQTKGWEISIHGFNHLYSRETNGKDYFGYGGKSEFFGESLESQKSKIYLGLKKFSEEKIKVRSFFAPNHTYDLNTFKSLQYYNIKYVIDGYGLYPYKKFNLIFVPQLFFNLKILPFGIQSTQIHLNIWSDKDIIFFEKFIKKNRNKIISFDDLTKLSITDRNIFTFNTSTKIILNFLRRLRKLL